MSNPGGELIPIGDLGTPGKYADNKAFSEISSSASWLPRVQLFGSNSGDVKRGKIAMGTYGLVRQKDNVEHLSSVCICLVLGWRPKAMSVGGDEILTAYNPESEVFKDIQEHSDEKDSGKFFGRVAA